MNNNDAMEEDNEEEESGSSDDGSESGEDDDDEEELILLLEARLQTCGGRDYEAHVQLIKLLKDHGQIKKLEKARDAFSQVFPLTDELWLQWISDEVRLAVSDAEYAKITSLYERSVADYNTPKLWESFMNHCQKRYREREDSDPLKPKLLAEARAVADRALTKVGSHFSEGQCLWELQRSFEMEVLEGMKGADDNAAVTLQVSRIRASFVGQIAHAGRSTKSAWDAYSSWEQESWMKELVHETVVKQTDKNAERESLEQAIKASSDDRAALLAAWQAFASYEEKHISRCNSGAHMVLQRTPSVHAARERDRVRSVYERAVHQCCLDPGIWLIYSKWETIGPEPSRALDVFKRGVRNVPFSAELWVAYALFVEGTADFSHAGGPEEEGKIEEVYVAAKSNIIYYQPMVEEYEYAHTPLLQLSLARCDYIRRRFLRRVPAGAAGNDSADVEKERQGVRVEFEAMAEALTVKGGLVGARSVLLYLGELEALIFAKGSKNITRAMGVWDRALKACVDDVNAWLAVVDVLRGCRQVGHARALLKRGCNVLQVISKEQPKGITGADMCAFVDRWVQLERREGDLDTYNVALQKYQSIAHLQPVHEAAFCKHGGSAGGKEGKSGRVRREAGEPEDPAKAARREEVMKKWAERKSADAGGKGKKRSNAEQEGAAQQDSSKRQKQTTSEGDLEEHKESKERGDRDVNAASGCSLFVQNLSADVTDAALKAHFARYGAVSACRVVKDKSGGSKGFGYVDFEGAESVTFALASQGDEMKLSGRILEVSRARPLKADASIKEGPNNKTLFVSGIAPTVSRETLRQLFSIEEHQVVDIRMMRDREGNLRGFGYIEYADEAGAQAGVKKDKSMLEGRLLRVALSDPSRSGSGGGGSGSSGGGRGRGGAHSTSDATVGGRGRGRSMLAAPQAAAPEGRSMLAMVPRAAMGRGGGADGGRGKARPGLGSGRGKAEGKMASDGKEEGRKEQGKKEEDSKEPKGGAPAVKDNDYFRNLFSKGGSL